MGKILCLRVLMPRRAAEIPALPDGAPSKVASRASDGWLAAFGGLHNGKIGRLRVAEPRGEVATRASVLIESEPKLWILF
jgi:hypothetical protein